MLQICLSRYKKLRNTGDHRFALRVYQSERTGIDHACFDNNYSGIMKNNMRLFLFAKVTPIISSHWGNYE